jgi:hypothetical protein
MRYMLLIYSKEQPGGIREASERNYAGHLTVMQDAARQGIFVAAEPLASTASATTVRVENGKALVTDGPFAETKEQLAGYYILDCRNLDEAIEWAARIPTACKGGEGCVEIRPLPGIPARPESESTLAGVRAPNG